MTEMSARESQRTRIKICGLTREQDIRDAVAAGADALGFVLWAGSKRAVGVARLAELSRLVPAFVMRVGLFVDASEAEVAAAAPHLDLLQFHGNETPEQCRAAGRPYIKALRMRDGIDLAAEAERFHDARGLLLDAYRPGVPGGTGETFDWSRIPRELPLPVILAGGLEAGNVTEAVRQVAPHAVDVSGGVESAPGEKSRERLQVFCQAVRAAD